MHGEEEDEPKDMVWIVHLSGLIADNAQREQAVRAQAVCVQVIAK